MTRAAGLALLVVLGALLWPAAASAHPLDETVQQVYVTPERTRLLVQLDISPNVLVAPPFAAGLDRDADGILGPAEIEAHTALVRAALHVTIDGHELDLAPVSSSYPSRTLLGAGGGTISLTWQAPLSADARRLEVHDAYTPGRTIVQSSVLQAADPVPVGDIHRADGGRTLTAGLHDAAAASTPPPPSAATPDTGGVPTMFDALRRPLGSPWSLAVLLGACVLLGALHALSPGHGKTLLAAYLVGERGTARHAAWLGTTVTISHTGSVVLLGAGVLLAGQWIVPEVVVPVLTVVAGLVVLVLGLRLVRRRLPTAALSRSHAHGHGHGHGHGTATVVATPPTRVDDRRRRQGLRGLTAMGLSAGMVPCPEALGVLLLAVGLGRVGLGLLMIVAFSVGLAAVLVGLGLLLVLRPGPVAALAARAGRRTAYLPMVSAALVAVLGVVTAVGGVLALTA